MIDNPSGQEVRYVSPRLVLLVKPGQHLELLEVIPAGGCAPPILAKFATYTGKNRLFGIAWTEWHFREGGPSHHTPTVNR